MSKSKIFIGISISFAVGILLAAVFQLGLPWLFAAMGIAAAVFAMAVWSTHSRPALAALFVFCAALGCMRASLASHPNEFAASFGEKPTLEGIITEDPDVRTDKQLITFLPNGHNQSLLLTLPLSQEFFYGDRVVVTGKLSEPKAFDDFDYPKYLERFNIYGLISYPKVLILQNHKASALKENLLHLKHWFILRLGAVLPPTESNLLAGILIGARKGLPTAVTDDFNATGLSHIVAISGYNITIIIILISSLVGFLGRRASFYFGLIVLIGFVILTGASASVVRAAVMGFMLLLAGNLGRQYSILPALFCAALIMLLINPKILYWDIGFQLSFAATLGIILFVPLLQKITAGWPKLWKIKEILITTMCAIISTLPLMLLHFGTLSLVAPLANILVLPLVPEVMLLGSLAALPLAGPGFALISLWFLRYILFVVNWLASWPFSNLALKISWPAFICLIALLFFIYRLLKLLAERAELKTLLNGEKIYVKLHEEQTLINSKDVQ
jgi:competence protein ComEC